MGTETEKNGNIRLLKTTQDKNDDTESSPRCKKIFLLGSLALLQFWENTCGALPTPFFARVIEEKGGTVFEASISLQIRMLAFILFSPLLGHYSVKIGAKRLLWLGVIVTALSQALFGALAFVSDHTVFFLSTMLSRLIYGIGKAALCVAVNIIAFRGYPNRISLVFGVLQASVGFAYLVGPVVGGILYDELGMAIPIIGSAVIMLLTGFLPCCLIDAGNHIQETDHINFSLRSFLLKPIVIATVLVICSECGIIGYLEVAFTLYFKQEGRSTFLTGIALMIAACAFAFSAPVIGFFVGKYGYIRRYSVGIGTILASSTLFVLTPDQSLGIIYVSCVLIGIFDSVSSISSMEVLMVAANERPLNERSNPALYGTVSGILQCAVGVGMLLFPSVASFIQTETFSSFTEIIFGLAGFNILAAVAHLFLTIVTHIYNK